MNWSYIAGFTDGEGYILHKVYTTREYSKNNGKYYTTSRLRRRIVLTQSKKQNKVLYKIKEFLDENLKTNVRIYDRKDGNFQLMIIRDADVYETCKRIVGHSIVKKEKIVGVLRSYENPELLK